MTLHYLFNTGLYRSNGIIIPTLATLQYAPPSPGPYYGYGLVAGASDDIMSQFRMLELETIPVADLVSPPSVLRSSAAIQAD